MKSNLMIKIIAGVLVAVVALVVVVGGKQRDPGDLQPVDTGPAMDENGLEVGVIDDQELEEKFGVEADTPDDTMHTLITEMEESQRKSDTVVEENRKLKTQTERLLKMEKTLQDRMDSKVYKTEQELQQSRQEMKADRQEMESLLSKLRNQVNELADTNINRPEKKTAYGFEVNDAGLPVGLVDERTGKTVDPYEVVWDEPLDAKTSEDDPDNLVFPTLNTEPLDDIAKVTGVKNKLDKAKLIKAYTIADNATLIGSVSMTALVGRIPTGGAVTDPYPFKILVGRENLSSNGIHIPGIVGIKMTGRATGDWTLSCVSGKIYSMTFTFQDGTIRTIPDPEDGGGDSRPLAWFSDQWGVPCVTGKRITNAVSYLSTRIGLSAASSYSRAKAAAELTTTVENGSTTTAVTGDPETLAKNTAISDGLNETTDWLDERQENSFDAVYVEPGTSLVVHVTQELQIDYNPEGRKVNHYAKIQSGVNHRID